MRVVYYCLPGFLEHVPQQVRALSRLAELHVVLEVSPTLWRYNLLDLPYPPWESGFYDGREFLRRHLPLNVWSYFENAAGIYLSAYGSRNVGATARTLVTTALRVREIDPDIIHLDGESVRAACWVPFARKPLVVSVHEGAVPPGDKAPLLGVAKDMLIPRARQLVVHSEECRRQLVARYGIPDHRISTALLGSMDMYMDWVSDDAPPACNENLVLFWGWLTVRKGIDVLLEAIPMVVQKMPGAQFVVAGQPVPGFPISSLTSMAEAASVKVIDRRLTTPELATLIRSSAVVVVPYREARQSGVILTAYAFDKPVVASDIPGLREQVWPRETGILFAPGDARALSDALLDLLEHSELRSAMSARIREVCLGPLSWSTFGDRVCSTYRSALQG